MLKTLTDKAKSLIGPETIPPYSLPKNWFWARLGDIVSITTGKKDANYGTVDGQYLFFTCAAEPIRCDSYSFEGESILLAGNGANVGLAIYYDGQFEAYQRTYVIQSQYSLPLKYIYYHLTAYWKEYNADKQYGSATNYIKLGNFKEYLIPIPTNDEAKRIVAKLDRLLARVDSCRAHLDRAAKAIKRFRQSVLNAAVTGTLNQSNFDKWQPFSLEQLGTLARGKSKHRPRNEPKLYGGPYPFIQTGDIANSGGKITSHKQTYSEEGLKQSKLFPAGTLCITIAANIADTAILTYPACFPDSVVGFIADDKVALNRFIQFAIDANKTMLDELATATAQKNINLSTFQKFKFRAPLVEEQVEIVMKAETLLSKADEMESKLAAARRRVDNLTASILAKAFRGELLNCKTN